MACGFVELDGAIELSHRGLETTEVVEGLADRVVRHQREVSSVAIGGDLEQSIVDLDACLVVCTDHMKTDEVP